MIPSSSLSFVAPDLGHTPLQESEAQWRLGNWNIFPGNLREAADQPPWGILGFFSAYLPKERCLLQGQEQ